MYEEIRILPSSIAPSPLARFSEKNCNNDIIILITIINEVKLRFVSAQKLI